MGTPLAFKPLNDRVSAPQADSAAASVKWPKRGFWKSLRMTLRFINRPPGPTGRWPAQPLPIHALTRAEILAAPARTLFRLGHSTILLKLRSGLWLTDPVFVERASFVQWAGPRRFHAPPIGLDALPDIEGVVLSHDHYDHLDRNSILALAPKVRHFLTPLGVGDRLISWGIDARKVVQLGWWQSATVGDTAGGLQCTATPAQHFSGRGLFDGDRTLWASWVLADGDVRIFFSGDSGYFDGFKTIAERLGPFDLTLMEAGAYDAHWPHVHMWPPQTVQTHIDLRGKRLLPIHNGTFDLGGHSWQDPFEQISAMAQTRGIGVLTPLIGAPMDMLHPDPTPAWWRDSQPQASMQFHNRVLS